MGKLFTSGRIPARSTSTHYRITWEVDIEAYSPEDAARQALSMQRDPESIATVFQVSDVITGESVTLDTEGD